MKPAAPRQPTRMCVGCRQRGPKEELVRIVRDPSGEVAADPTGKAPGRGAYIHPDVRCFEQATRRGRLAGALRTGIGTRQLERLKEVVLPEGAR